MLSSPREVAVRHRTLVDDCLALGDLSVWRHTSPRGTTGLADNDTTDHIEALVQGTEVVVCSCSLEGVFEGRALFAEYPAVEGFGPVRGCV